MFEGGQYKRELKNRINTVILLLDSGDPIVPNATESPVRRETRGLAVVLLFACYENLMRTLCRGLLEEALKLRVGNKRLHVGFQQFAVFGKMQALTDRSPKHFWDDTGKEILSCAFDGRDCSINPNIFPSDGSFMRKSQVSLIFRLFQLGRPGPILLDVWDKIDTIVVERNKIAHGELTPDIVGRNYTSSEIRVLVQSWQDRWSDVIDHVEAKACRRDFFRH